MFHSQKSSVPSTSHFVTPILLFLAPLFHLLTLLTTPSPHFNLNYPLDYNHHPIRSTIFNSPHIYQHMMKLCKHYKPLKFQKIANFLTNHKPKCQNQNKHTPEKDNLWQCMTCPFVGCGRTNRQECAKRHSFDTSHAICISPKTAEIYCYKCDQSLQEQIQLANDMDMESKDLDLLVEFTEKCTQLCESKKTKGEKMPYDRMIVESYDQKHSTNGKSNMNSQIQYKNHDIYEQHMVKTGSKLVNESANLKVFGLSNLGNTCFYNSVLQCLYATTTLHSKYSLIDFGRLDEDDSTADQVRQVYESIEVDENFTYAKPKQIPSTNINRRFQSFLSKGNSTKGTISPSDLFEAVGSIKSRFRSMAQQDAQELLRCLLDGLNEGEITYLNIDRRCLKLVDLKGKREKWTAIEQVFGCFLASRLHCLNCQKVSWTLDLCLDLSIEISSMNKVTNLQLPHDTPIPKEEINQSGLEYPSSQHPVPDILAHFFSAEPLSKLNYFSCENCKASKATKKLYIKDPPKNLTIVLKRFTNTGHKNNASVPFPFQLDITGACLNPGITKYSLYGVVVHQGGAGGGHYIAYTRRGNTWFYFSDSSCREVHVSVVRSAQAYVLFYEFNEEGKY